MLDVSIDLMRRLLSLLLLATFGMPLWAPLLALGQGTEAALPACCRRAGKHHCETGMVMGDATSTRAEQTPQWKAPRQRCPYCPGAVSAAYHPEVGSAAAAEAVFAHASTHPLGIVQTESKRRIARDRSRQKRGPPVSLLA